MPDCCSVYQCTNRSNRNKDKRFFRIPREILSHRGDKTRDILKRRRAKWLANLSLLTKGVESRHARVCSDHFVKGKPINQLISACTQLFSSDDALCGCKLLIINTIYKFYKVIQVNYVTKKTLTGHRQSTLDIKK